MDRRNFIKNSVICLSTPYLGCKCFSKNIEKEIPTSVILESCTLCQLACPECWRTCNPTEIPLGYLKFNDFKKFIKLNPQVKNIGLASRGEMFLNPELADIIKYANKKDVKLSAYAGVNLNTLSDEMAELLVKEKFNGLVVSIDGASQETYSIYRQGGDFNKVIENIKKIQYYQKKYNDFEHPKLVWKFIVFGHNEHEIPIAKQMAKKLDIELRYDLNFAINYSPVKNIKLVEKETGLDYSYIYQLDKIQPDYVNNFGFYKMFYDRYIKGSNWFYCTGFFDQPEIFFDGRFLGCCMSFSVKNPQINMFETSISEALENSEVKRIIDTFGMKDKERILQKTKCDTCDVYKFLKDSNLKITLEQHKQLAKKYQK